MNDLVVGSKIPPMNEDQINKVRGFELQALELPQIELHTDHLH